MAWNICFTNPHNASRKNSTSKEKVSGGLSFLKQITADDQKHSDKFRKKKHGAKWVAVMLNS